MNVLVFGNVFFDITFLKYFIVSLQANTEITMDNHLLEHIRITTSEAIKKKKKKIFEHALDDEHIWEWLRNFNPHSLRKMKYRGWAPNRPFPKDHPRFDPNSPDLPKHGSDTDYFLYYTIKINKWDYWVNVKMHRDYGEVIYVIEKAKPSDLSRGHKKK